jgi:hypothetical protein
MHGIQIPFSLKLTLSVPVLLSLSVPVSFSFSGHTFLFFQVYCLHITFWATRAPMSGDTGTDDW